jgi:hypothetical protein
MACHPQQEKLPRICRELAPLKGRSAQQCKGKFQQLVAFFRNLENCDIPATKKPAGAMI